MAMRGISWKTEKGDVLGQIDMRKAHKLFADGKPFFIAMENMRPDFAIEIAGEDFANETFDKIINAYLYYNRGRDWGYRCRFYVKL